MPGFPRSCGFFFLRRKIPPKNPPPDAPASAVLAGVSFLFSIPAAAVRCFPADLGRLIATELRPPALFDGLCDRPCCASPTLFSRPLGVDFDRLSFPPLAAAAAPPDAEVGLTSAPYPSADNSSPSPSNVSPQYIADHIISCTWSVDLLLVCLYSISLAIHSVAILEPLSY